MHKLNILHKFRVVLVVGLLLLLLFFTSPDQLPLPLLMLPFLLIFLSIYLLTKWIFGLKQQEELPKSKRVIAVIIASVPVLLLVLQSIGQLSIRDAFIIVGLCFGLLFYFAKTNLLQ